MDSHYIDGLIDTTRRVLASGATGANGHGNVSLRVAGADEMYFTSASTLAGLTAVSIARVRLDGTLIEGQLTPIQGAVVDMHTSRYRASGAVQCVLHTHSPMAFEAAGTRSAQ